MNETELINLIKKVTQRLVKKYKFSYFDEDDLLSECYLEVRDALEKYDELRPLEGFIYSHLKNRILNIQRKVTAKHSPLKRKILSPSSINDINLDSNSSFHVGSEILDKLSKDELIEILNRDLPAEERADFLKISAGVKITQARLEKVRISITEILRKYDED